MPTAGTHITLIERLALEPDFAPLLGDPLADPTDPRGMQMRYAKLGAIGPDLFYAMLDMDYGVQDLANFFAKYSGAVECIGHVMGEVKEFGAKVESDASFGVSDTAHQIVGEIDTVAKNLIATFQQLVTIAVTDGYNFFTFFEAHRQKDEPRTSWYWADFLHYAKSGAFARELFVQAGNDPKLRAYAFGYLSHYVTDVVGHPYVNQVTGSPYRMYWQRHHLVENFIDAYVWDRWHDRQPAPAPPSTEEAPLDRVRATPHVNSGDGASFTYARLNDHINIGSPGAADPVDRLIEGICNKIDGALEDVGIAEPLPAPPGDLDFVRWTQMLSNTFRIVYPDPAKQATPQNLANPSIGGLGRTDGYPTPDDVASAYVVMRLFLRSATEETVEEPEFPDIGEDVWNAIKQALDKVGQDLSSVTPPPGLRGGGSFSLSSLWDALKRWVEWACETASKLVEAAIDLLKVILNAAGALIVDLVKAVLYIIKKGLYDLWKAFRFFLVRAAYAVPLTAELNDTIAGSVPTTSLWTVPRKPQENFPIEEVPHPQRDKFFSTYAPWMFPTAMAEVQALGANVAEMPLTWGGPYAAAAKPDDFIEPAAGPRVMLDRNGPLDLAKLPNPAAPVSSFGGAMDNCRIAFRNVAEKLRTGASLPADLFPDYNLDGDRGYAWPCWDVGQDPVTKQNSLLDPAQPTRPVNVTAVAFT